MKLVILATLLVNGVVANAYHLDDFDTGLDHRGLIVGGETAEPKQFPYQVYLRINVGCSPGHYCGGTLISNQWIVTSAHCTDGINYLDAHLGALNRKNLTEPGLKIIRVPKENVFSHENFIPNTDGNDISLIKLPDPVELSDYIQPAKLPKMGESLSYVGEKAITSGWGQRSDFDFKGSDVLLWIEVPVMDNVKCKKIFHVLKDSHICIDTTGKKSTCYGDSGGPLVLADGNTTLIGLTSFGMCSCEREYPEVFTRITSYLDWIKDKTGIANE